jgi:uncharacterized membrane protein
MTQPMTSDITSDDKLWALLSWIIWPIAIVALLMDDKKKRPFIKYNAVNSLALNVVAYGLIIIGIGACTGPLATIYSIVLGIQAYKGQWVSVPVVTDFVKKQNWA